MGHIIVDFNWAYSKSNLSSRDSITIVTVLHHLHFLTIWFYNKYAVGATI